MSEFIMCLLHSKHTCLSRGSTKFYGIEPHWLLQAHLRAACGQSGGPQVAHGLHTHSLNFLSEHHTFLIQRNISLDTS
jgi:hypothetical protein